MRIDRRRFVSAGALLPLWAPGRATSQTFSTSFPLDQAAAAYPIALDQQARQISATRLRQGRTETADDLKVRTIDQVAAILRDRAPGHAYPDGTAMLFYQHVGYRKLRAWLIGAQGLMAASELDVGENLEQLTSAAEELRAALNVDGRGVSRAPIFRPKPGRTRSPVAAAPAPAASPSPAGGAATLDRATNILASLLLPPEIRRGLAGVRHLIVVGNGVIQTTPMALLPIGSGRLLIDAMTISMLGSPSELAQEVPPWSWSRAYSAPLIFGDPQVPEDPMAVHVPPLPGAREEALALARLTAKAAQVGAAASKADFLERWRTASTLYVAAHGVADLDEPLRNSILMLSGDSTQSAYLTAREILPRSFPVVPGPGDRIAAALVVLSACQSGLGVVMDSGVIGMARAFNQRGAPRVVMSLWSVSDTSSLSLMNEFNRECMRTTPADALRTAMLRTRRAFPHPSHWAPFTHFGTPR